MGFLKDVPQKLIDQVLECVRELSNISPFFMNPNLISSLNLELRNAPLLQDGCRVEPCETFFSFIDQQLRWSVKEMRKMSKYTSLADEVIRVRDDLAELVGANPDLDYLNFGDSMTFSHGDLNAGNILVEPNTWELTGIIDWDFCSHGFDCHQLGFFQDWFDTIEQRDAIKHRVAVLTRDLDWTKRNQKGNVFRNFLFTLANDANHMGFYCSTWFYTWKNPGLGVRVHIDRYAAFVREGLDRWPLIMNQLKNYRSYLKYDSN